ncbi:hypothetical protein QBC34DRAFT_479435 [Podospora aff. communis PSN243]|uniref:NACHT domain-containing protein n=1 Tax=Podospora aff. communis PSN243 TaxID=3040156 RepID=A0AAV9G4U3_9PEZI|nr:hypothetical protein QBC34DRAFT_479435 [Podospora aff. communis PSN243]
MPCLLPTRAETKAAFQRLCEQLVSICLFIDGLDEYSERREDGISLIRLLSEAPRIKVLVSSRPEPAFVAAFAGDVKLRMQDLNKQDIQKYVEDTVGSHPILLGGLHPFPRGGTFPAMIKRLLDAGCTASGNFLTPLHTRTTPWLEWLERLTSPFKQGLDQRVKFLITYRNACSNQH